MSQSEQTRLDQAVTLDHQTEDEANVPLTTRLGRYRIVDILGRGSFGIVYKAYDEELQRQVAVKVPHRYRIASTSDVEMYLTEARILAHLDHPGLVPVYDVGRTGEGLCYVVSKFVEGSDLKRRLAEARPPIVESAELVARAAEALHHAHQHGLIHRDVKPANILLTSQGLPIIADFGLALREEDFGRGPGSVGTPMYMSPEQARGEGHLVDARTDVYSLGVVLYELLTGRPPFRATTREELFEKITTLEARPPRQVDERIPKELDRICLKCLCKRASDRYSTALDLVEDLRYFLNNQTANPSPPVAARPAADGLTAPAEPTSAGSKTLTALESSRRSISVIPKGLRSFDAGDADFFMELLPGPRGRDGLAETIRFWKTRLEETDADKTFRVGLVYGPSGCGKSSFVRAGLLPRLADSVVSVYVEATAQETEARLLRAVQKCCSGQRAGSLAQTLAGLRRGHGLPQGRKLVLVLDQFEQWLHAARDRSNTQLVEALRQCDGRHLQCVVLVRDDFWLAVSRFLRELEVRLVEGDNVALVDLFDPLHARRVLVGFGQAYGRLPQPPAALDAEQEAFLDQAVNGLAREGKIIPVRLSLFADMVKGKPWTPATLKKVGGMEGIGVTFLEETFSSPSAPPQHRLHQRAARAVLKALLPQRSPDIKGQMQSYRTLLEASGYDRQPAEFDELLHILDNELRLVTPTEPLQSEHDETTLERRESRSKNRDLKSRAERDSAHEVSSSDTRNYQLTHDYLVPALREWLTRKQRETRRGRLQLQLAERASLWNARPEKRYLLSWWEWCGVLLLTHNKDWTEPEKKMMAAATRHYSFRSLGVTALAVIALAIGWQIKVQHDQQKAAIYADGLVDKLLVADLGEVPDIVEVLEGCRERADPRLQAIVRDPNVSAKDRLRASLALLPVDASQVDYLFTRLPDADLDELLVLRKQLLPWSGRLVERLWQRLQERGTSAEQQLRLACVLAAFDAENERWSGVARNVAEQLVRENPYYLKLWADALRPARKFLLQPLGAIFRAPAARAADRAIATRILGDYVAADPAFLVELIKDADSWQYGEMIGKLKPYPQETLDAMRAELSKHADAGASEEAKDHVARRQANALVTLYRLGEWATVWPFLRHSADPRRRSYLIHELKPLGADPLPLLRRWEQETDVSSRRALLLTLGEFDPEELPAPHREAFVVRLKDVYEKDSDPGIHAAAAWLLTQWGERKEVRRRDALLKGSQPGSNSWYVNGQGHTMVLLDGRGQPLNLSSGRRINRRFAIASKEVTAEQFLRFRLHSRNTNIAPTLDCPVNVITWYDAARYCRWLSEREGIAPEQMCYPPVNEIKEGMKPYPNYLTRKGYRLPTGAEWEFACRAGASSRHYHGNAPELLRYYAWYADNSGMRSHPVGNLKPNDFGLFDMLGNSLEWCQERAGANVIKATEDVEDTDPVLNTVPRALHGGMYSDQPFRLVPDAGDGWVPSTAWNSGGFRVARTIEAEP